MADTARVSWRGLEAISAFMTPISHVRLTEPPMFRPLSDTCARVCNEDRVHARRLVLRLFG